MITETWTPTTTDFLPTGAHALSSSPSPEVVELVLLLPQWQMSALEDQASHYGMTVGQMLRRVLSELCPPQASDHSINM